MVSVAIVTAIAFPVSKGTRCVMTAMALGSRVDDGIINQVMPMKIMDPDMDTVVSPMVIIVRLGSV